MSVVVAVQTDRAIFMAADSLCCFGDDTTMPATNAVSTKIMRVGDSILGGTGWGVYDDIFRDFLDDRNTPSFENETAIFRFFLDLWKALHDKYTFVNDQAAGKDTPFGDLDSTFLIANASGIYKIASDLSVTKFAQYYAVGSGSEYALGALHARYESTGDASAIATAAVEAGIAFDTHCGGAVDLLAVQSTSA